MTHAPEVELETLRGQTAYPALRSLISILHILGIAIFSIITLLFLLIGFAMVSSNSEEGIKTIFAGIGLLLATGLWWKLFKPVASLIVDIADAAISISERQRNQPR